MQEEFDIVIIGSGAGGAPIASELTKKGKSVLVLEKGPMFRTQMQDPCGLSDFKRDEIFATGAEKRIQVAEMANYGRSYFTSHVEPDVNDEPHVYRNVDGKDFATLEGYTAHVVGGGTQIYGAVSLRFSEDDFKLATFNNGRTDIANDPNEDVKKETRDWPISYNDLEPYYCKAEELIGINGEAQGQIKPFSRVAYQKPLKPNPISKYIVDGMKALNMQMYRTPLAVITEDHKPSGRKVPADPEVIKTSFVNRYGDPIGYKSSTWVALLYPLKEFPNFQIRTNCVVTHLKCENDKVTGVEYLDPAGRARSVKGKIVIVACSAIESVRLLMLSGSEDRKFAERFSNNDLLGKYFLTHCFGGAEAIMPECFDKSQSLDSDWATDHCARKEFLLKNGLWAGGAIYNNTSDQALPISLVRTHGSQDIDTIWKAFVEDAGLTGEKMVDFLDKNVGRRLSVSFMANQVPLKTNRIELHPIVKDKWNRPVAYIIKQWHSHDIYLMDVLAKQCADILRFGGDNGKGEFPVEGFGSVYMAENASARIANHILGGARFGTDEKDSVLDPSCRVWQFDNLYVTDGSFMPTSGGANPTLTIQANSFRVADILSKRL